MENTMPNTAEYHIIGKTRTNSKVKPFSDFLNTIKVFPLWKEIEGVWFYTTGEQLEDSRVVDNIISVRMKSNCGSWAVAQIEMNEDKDFHEWEIVENNIKVEEKETPYFYLTSKAV